MDLLINIDVPDLGEAIAEVLQLSGLSVRIYLFVR
jgi:hypothetical protein